MWNALVTGRATPVVGVPGETTAPPQSLFPKKSPLCKGQGSDGQPRPTAGVGRGHTGLALLWALPHFNCRSQASPLIPPTTRTCMHTYAVMYAHRRPHIYSCICKQAYTHTQSQAHTHIHMHSCTCICTHTCTHILIHT